VKAGSSRIKPEKGRCLALHLSDSRGAGRRLHVARAAAAAEGVHSVGIFEVEALRVGGEDVLAQHVTAHEGGAARFGA